MKLARYIRVLGLLLLASPVVAGEIPELKLPESMRVQIVAQNMNVNGLNTRIYAFNSPQSADQLAAHFHAQFDGNMARSYAKPWDILTSQEGDYLITVQSQSADLGKLGGQTRGFIAFADLFAAAQENRQPPKADLPMLPGTRLLQDLQAKDQDRPSRTVILHSNQSAHQNLEFYRAYFDQQGYEPVAPGALAKQSNRGAMILNRGSQQLNLAVVQRGGQTLITIVRVDQ